MQFTNIFINFTGPIDAYQTIWLIGDKFVTDTVGQYFQGGEDASYMRDKYNVKTYHANRFSLMTSVTARLHNKLIEAINENKIFPKAIIFIIDGDVIKMISFNNYGISEIYGQVLKNLMVGVHRTILACKESLPNRSK